MDYGALMEAIKRGHDRNLLSVSETTDLAESYLRKGTSPSEMFRQNIEVVDG